MYEFQAYPSFWGGIIEVCAILTEKWGSEARVCPNRGAFLCPCVGAYCIRPTNVPPKEGEGPAYGRVQAFAIHGMALCGAYAIRPYPDGQKMIAVGVCSAALSERQAAFGAYYGVGGGKCGALDCFTVVVYTNLGAFLCRCVGAY